MVEATFQHVGALEYHVHDTSPIPCFHIRSVAASTSRCRLSARARRACGSELFLVLIVGTERFIFRHQRSYAALAVHGQT